MSIGNVLVNQALGAASRQAQGALKKVLGNLPGSALSGPGSKSAFGISSNMPQSINLQYPLNVENDIQQGHYIMFFINSSEPAVIKKAKAAKEAAEILAASNAAAEMGGGYGGPPAQLDGPGFVSRKTALDSAPKQAVIITRKPTVHMAKAISLYMPPSVKSIYTMGYREAEIGIGAESAANEIQKAIKGGAFKSLSAAWNYTKARATKDGAQVLTDVAAAGIFKASALLTNTIGVLGQAQGAAAAAQISAGVVMSDKMELLFTGVGRRKFSFTFTFIPKSEKESEMVDEIVYTFKLYMTPDFGELSAAAWGVEVSTDMGGRILKIPNTFDIKYMYQGADNPWINKISTCYLVNMDVQYGSDKAGFFEPLAHPRLETVGPPPTHTTISLNFEEIEKISRPRIKQGY